VGQHDRIGTEHRFTRFKRGAEIAPGDRDRRAGEGIRSAKLSFGGCGGGGG
jgi:hypothetical protein